MSSNNFGLNNDYDYMELCLDSLDATDTFATGVASTDWPMFVIAGKGPIDNIVALKIMEVQIPASWYIINTSNSGFVLTEAGYSDYITKNVYLPIGNYTTSQMCTNIGVALTQASAAMNGFAYTCTFSENSGKFSIFNNSGGSSPFVLTFGAGYGIPGIQPNSGNTNPRLYIGFPPGSTYSIVGGGGDVIVAPNYNMLGGPAYVYLNSRTIGSNVDVYLPEGAFNLYGGKAGPQLAKIPVNANTGGWVTWSDPDPQKYFKFDTSNTLNLLDFYITLGNTTGQNPLQLNGVGFSIKVAILLQRTTNMGNGEQAYNGRIFSRQGFNSNK